MKISIKYVLFPLLFLGALALAWYYGYKTSLWQQQSETQVEVLLERMKDVDKFVAVEGYFSEIYDYKDYYVYDISPFRKKALIRVKAKVLAGYDLDNLTIDADKDKRILRIKNLGEPIIIAVDHELDYYDLQEGSFNQFDETKLNELNSSAKDFISKQAEESGLLGRAEERKTEFFFQLKEFANSMGWEVEFPKDQIKG